MSYALRALILIRLDARQGIWVTVADLAEHLGLQPASVAFELSVLGYQSGVRLQHEHGTAAIVAAMVPAPARDTACA